MFGDPRDARANAHLGRYDLVARLATGGMGEIFLARLEGAAGFEKLYVVKRILPHLAGDGRFRAMLIDEARIASRLSHPSICQVYELGETDGELYIVMEYLEGITLLPLLRHAARQRRPLELGMVGGILSQITEALHYAHELRDRDGTFLNIIHRDVTPSNIIVTESGVAKVLDFGIAKAKNVSTETQTGTVKGKHAYMAPEQLRGQAIDRRVDVYAVGVLLYEMLALRRLFQRSTDYLTLQAVMEQPVPDVRAFRPDLPAALASALGRALHRDRDQRYETVRQLGGAVLEAIEMRERVWKPSQLGEQLGARFAQELARRSAAVSAAIARPGEAARAGGDALSQVPAVAPLDGPDELSDLDDDADLPSVDTAVHAPGPAGSALAFVGHGDTRVDRAFPRDQLAPAGAEPSSARGAELAALPAVRRSRAWLWPAAAGMLLLLGASALFVLWQSRAPAQTVLVVTDRRGPGAAPGATNAGAESGAAAPPSEEAAGASARDAGATQPAGDSPAQADPPDGATGANNPGPRRDARSVLQARISALRPQMDACLAQHPVTTAIIGKLELQIEASGEVAKVAIEPAALAATEMAACIKRVFGAQRFPRQREPLSISLTISTKVR